MSIVQYGRGTQLKLEEWIAILGGGGLLWKFGPVLSRYFAPPGPILALSPVNMQGRGNSVYSRVLQVENIGDKPALEITWEIRDYYHPDCPPPFQRVKGNRTIPLKPSEQFVLEVDSDASGPAVPGFRGLSTADFSHYEILIWYRGPSRVKYLSWVSLALGHVTRHKSGLNPAQRAFSFVGIRIWGWHCWHGTKIQLRVRLFRRAKKTLKDEQIQSEAHKGESGE